MPTVLKGQVVSTKMDKTAVVTVTSLKQHRLYSKKYRVTHRYMVHDPKNELVVGDTVEIIETRPLSKNKRWAVSKRTPATAQEAEL